MRLANRIIGIVLWLGFSFLCFQGCKNEAIRRDELDLGTNLIILGFVVMLVGIFIIIKITEEK